MKYLIWLLVLAGFWWWWRQKNAHATRRQTPPAAGPTGVPQEMVNCPVCGLHLPRQDAIAGRIGHYCSEAHRDRQEP
ncbi:MAG: hypothetical protein RIT26_1483 [Pseudomonadota bacterium]|jgi:uncharacterized protein